MAQEKEKLSAKTVEGLTETTSVGGCPGLTLVVEGTARYWIVRYRFAGKRTSKGLGGYPAVTLAQARVEGDKVHKLVAQGQDPKAQKEIEAQAAADQVAQTQEAAEKKALTVEVYARAWIEQLNDAKTWKSRQNYLAFLGTFENHVFPAFGDVPLQDVRAPHVVGMIEKIMHTKNAIANKLSSRLRRMFELAIVKELHPGPNPAHLIMMKTIGLKRKKVTGHKSLPHDKLSGFFAALENLKSSRPEVWEGRALGVTAVRFAILTGARPTEIKHARRDQFDLDNKVWNRKASDMKADEPHRVPLSSAAMEILLDQIAFGDRMRARAGMKKAGDNLIFGRGTSLMTTETFLKTIRKILPPDDEDGRNFTTHGFRATFKDWGREHGWSEELTEFAIAHAFGSDQSQSYTRGDLLEQRRPMMEEYAAYVTGKPLPGAGETDAGEKVTPIQAGVAILNRRVQKAA